jgi:hypothetical protein
LESAKHANWQELDAHLPQIQYTRNSKRTQECERAKARDFAQNAQSTQKNINFFVISAPVPIVALNRSPDPTFEDKRGIELLPQENKGSFRANP